jgi:hypothetical protein
MDSTQSYSLFKSLEHFPVGCKTVRLQHTFQCCLFITRVLCPPPKFIYFNSLVVRACQYLEFEPLLKQPYLALKNEMLFYLNQVTFRKHNE